MSQNWKNNRRFLSAPENLLNVPIKVERENK